MSNEITATCRTKIINHESNMLMARIAAGNQPLTSRKYVLPFEIEALKADLQAAEVSGTSDKTSLLDCIHLPNGKKLRDCTGAELMGYEQLEKLVYAHGELGKLIGAELDQLAAQGQA